MAAGLTGRLLESSNPEGIIAALVDFATGEKPGWSRQIDRHAPLLAKLGGGGKRRYTFGDSDITGGLELQHTVVFKESDNHSWIQGYEPFTIKPQDFTVTLRAKLAEYVTTVSFNQRELDQVKGPAAWASISRERMMNMLESSLLHMQRMVYSDGMLYGGKSIVGLQSLINSASLSGAQGDTTMDLNSKDFPFWRPQRISLKDEGRLDSPSALADAMMQMKKLVQFRLNNVDCVVTTRELHNTYERFLQPAQRITKLSDAEAGYRSLDWDGLDVMWDDFCPANHMYFISTSGLKLRAHRDRNMKRVGNGPIRSINQLAYVIPVSWMGQMMLTERRSQGVILAEAA